MTLNPDKVPNKMHPHGFMMPVKLEFNGMKATPKIRDGKYVYALPGGGEYVL